MCVKKRNWPVYAAWIAGTEAVGALSGWLTRGGAERYASAIVKPPLSPPGPEDPLPLLETQPLGGHPQQPRDGADPKLQSPFPPLRLEKRPAAKGFRCRAL